VLQVGNRAEPDGRVSVARLTLDPRAKASTWPPARRPVPAEKGATGLIKSQGQ